MAKQLNTFDYRDGGLEFAKRIRISLEGGSLTLATLEHEIKAWESAQYENNKTQIQFDRDIAASHAAQLREVSKVQKEVLAQNEQLVESHRKVSAIYARAIPASGSDSLASHPSRNI